MKILAIPFLILVSVPVVAFPHSIETENIEGSFMTSEEVEKNRLEKEQKMEEREQNASTIIESNRRIDYQDRPRTRKARGALDTGTDASED